MESKNYRLNESKMFADVTDGIAIIINAATGIYYGMNGYGTGIFDNLLAGSSTDDILAAIQELPGAPANAEESLKPYTVEELLERAEKGRKEIARGNYVTSEDLFRDLFEEFGISHNDIEEINRQLEENPSQYAEAI